jgi:hypothetical protein
MTLEDKKAQLQQLQGQRASMGGEANAELTALQDQQALSQQRGKAAELAQLESQKRDLERSDARGGWDEFWEGVALSGMEMMYGLEDLVGEMDESERAVFESVKADASDSGWTMTGKVASEIAQLGIPAGALIKAAKGVSKVKAATKIAGIEAGVAGAEGAARLPDADETRMGNAAFDAGGALVGHGIGKVLGKTMKGLDKTDEAQKLLDEGVYLTPGQQAKSEALANLETAAEVTPFLARGTKAARKEAGESWNKNVLNTAAPEGTVIDAVGTEGGKQLKKAVEAGYTQAWKGVKPLDRTVRGRYANRLRKTQSRLGKKDQRVIDNVADDIDKIGSAKGLDDVLRREIGTAGAKKPELRKILQKTRRELRKVAPVNNQKALRKMDKNYPDFLTAEDAITRAKKTDGVFTPDQLTMSSGKIGKKNTATGDAPLQDSARAGRETVGKKEGGAPLDFMRRLAGAVHVPGTTPAMRGTGEILMGNTGTQQWVTRGLNSGRADAIRELMNPARAGAAGFSMLDEEF